jgi:hypothetical protein
LAEQGLIRRIASSTYVITEEGEAYLEGKFNVDSWVYIDEDGKPTNAVEGEGVNGDAFEPDSAG